MYLIETLDLNVIGLTFNIVGIFYLANSIKFKRSKRVLHEFFGVQKTFPLKDIREHVVRKIQVYLGFGFLFAGYLIQLTSYIIDIKSQGDESTGIPSNLLAIAGILLFSIVVIALVLKLVQVGWTRWTFKRLLIEFFRHHEWELVTHTDVAKEMGELLKLPRNKDDSIEEYILKIKSALHIEKASMGEAANNRRERAEIPVKTAKLSGSQLSTANYANRRSARNFAGACALLCGVVMIVLCMKLVKIGRSG